MHKKSQVTAAQASLHTYAKALKGRPVIHYKRFVGRFKIIINSYEKFFSVLSLFVLASGCTNQKLSIIPLKMLNYSRTPDSLDKSIINKTDFYLVKDYRDNKKSLHFIDSFVAKNKARDIYKYADYTMIFYKESSQTNVKNIIENPRVIVRYSQDNDMIFEYNWHYGKFLVRYKLKDGQIIEPEGNDVIIGPAPPLKTD